MNFGSMSNNCDRVFPVVSPAGAQGWQVDDMSMGDSPRASFRAACPVCSCASGQEVVWGLERVADRYVCPCGEEGDVALRIMGCPACGHLFVPEQPARPSVPASLSNRPVHQAMERYLDELLEWVGLDQVRDRTVIDVGAGTGGLSRRAAALARRVVAYEPNPGLRPEMLGLGNIELRNEGFSAADMAGRADLVLCRQVLEHTPAPADFLAEMARALSPRGVLYLEVPDAAYIVETAGFYEFHPEHLQYFHRDNLVAMAGVAGLELLRAMRIKDGHDMGLLFRLGNSTAGPGAGLAEGLAGRLRLRARRIGEFAAHCPGPLYLYGATWVAASLLAGVPEVRPAAVLDDNVDLHGLCVPSPQGAFPVCGPGEVGGMAQGTVLICSYIHAAVITRRLREEHGFAGAVTDLVRAGSGGGR